MRRSYNLDDFDEILFEERDLRRTNEGRSRQTRRGQHAIVEEQLFKAPVEEDIASARFNPTLSSSRHERMWILNYLGGFYDTGQITDVLRKVKGGKEATVFVCSTDTPDGPDLIAAKIYRPRMFRSLRNDARYRQGRSLIDAEGKDISKDQGLLRAVKRRTHVGKEMEHISWLMYEYTALQKLSAAGLKVPRPITTANNTILMEYFGELETPAPALIDLRLPRREAQTLFEQVIDQVERMLRCNLIHGDLSAYNVLYFNKDFRIIDFPQVVDVYKNPDAQDIFVRDVARVCDYFNRCGVKVDGQQLALDLWVKTME